MYTKEFNCLFASCTVQQGVQMTTTMSFTTRIIKNLGTNSMSIGLSSIIYMLSAVCFAKMASSDVWN